ncbi:MULTISPECIES: glycoside hydrolase family 88 protein [unclassified Rathayibacter]|jgi:unsaturated chondroitin disaccharide hydrolase|uniref:glycoside hydrolase family 88 protein n=1 Tax=unclassified Rathayibacter TaxID=2609250 RepID=UPI000F4C407E|nr:MULTISPECIES: glycoside hydrolase family 88 protein [unclassified Rathayibacter]MCJ1705779.1 glycoside hydrolase family 88 protein [Rathayibacter sp. VKM Ac-2926]ROS22153.1 unsaturated chondroitin disaccharide hydrolase [Rathayibacter sp. PhB127]
MTTTPPTTGRTTTEQAVADALEVVRRMIGAFGSAYPDDTTTDGRYPIRPAAQGFAAGANRGWTTSFWPGMQWIAWEATGEDVFLDAARGHLQDFARRVREGEDLETHDLGFLYTLSCVAPFRLLGDELGRTAALEAAEHLMTRFLPTAGIVQAWGDLRDPKQRGRTIIDSLMNMPLLTWAGEQTGDPRYAEAVARHIEALRVNILRPDSSTFHTFYWDAETGEPLRGGTEQGAFDDSCWARGQAWGVYGFAMGFRVLGDDALLEASRACAEYFLAHLPRDLVPYWDLVYAEGSDAPRDSSAAAIAVCGLLELALVETDAECAARWRDAAHRILAALIRECAPESPEAADTVLLHSVYDLPKNVGVDEGTLWGDYFYLEALMRVSRPEWRPYW